MLRAHIATMVVVTIAKDASEAIVLTLEEDCSRKMCDDLPVGIS